MVQGNVYSARIFFSVGRPIPLIVWSGMYLYRLILQVLESNGLSLLHSEPKPFSISPIYVVHDSGEQRFIDRGVLNPGDLYTFRFSSLDREVFEQVVKVFASSKVEVFDVVRVEQTLFTIPININCVEDPSKSTLIIMVRFSPTIFKFWGHEVLYPSPIRFTRSIMKYLQTAIGLDISKCFGDLTRTIELINSNIRIDRFPIGKDSFNKDRVVTAFYGLAKYAVVISNSFVDVFKDYILKFAKLTGVGKNRSIGFGDITEISIEKP